MFPKQLGKLALLTTPLLLSAIITQSCGKLLPPNETLIRRNPTTNPEGHITTRDNNTGIEIPYPVFPAMGIIMVTRDNLQNWFDSTILQMVVNESLPATIAGTYYFIELRLNGYRIKPIIVDEDSETVIVYNEETDTEASLLVFDYGPVLADGLTSTELFAFLENLYPHPES